jgi:hypothetical protein
MLMDAVNALPPKLLRKRRRGRRDFLLRYQKSIVNSIDYNNTTCCRRNKPNYGEVVVAAEEGSKEAIARRGLTQLPVEISVSCCWQSSLLPSIIGRAISDLFGRDGNGIIPFFLPYSVDVS